ncbi:YpsA SLOG family protein [Spirosoma koreense]
MNSFPLLRIISRGQTGIDQLGLEVARSLDIPTGGVAPKGYLTENGPDERLREYGLTEHTSAQYPPRTRANVRQSDGTVIFGQLTDGTKLALDTCIRENKTLPG